MARSAACRQGVGIGSAPLCVLLAQLQQLVNPPAALLQELLVATPARRAVLAAAETEERALYAWQRQQQCWQLTTIAARLLNYPDPDLAGLDRRSPGGA